MNRRLTIFALIVLALSMVWGVAGCKPPPAPDPVPATKPAEKPKPLVLVVPGLKYPQTSSVVERVKAAFGNQVNVADFGTGRNGYLGDLQKFAAQNAHAYIIAIGHSYGTDKIDQQWADLGDVRLVVLLDPVPEELFGEYTVPRNVRRVMVITGDWSGMFRAKINGPYEEYKVHRKHSAMAHDPTTLALIESAIREAIK